MWNLVRSHVTNTMFFHHNKLWLQILPTILLSVEKIPHFFCLFYYQILKVVNKLIKKNDKRNFHPHTLNHYTEFLFCIFIIIETLPFKYYDYILLNGKDDNEKFYQTNFLYAKQYFPLSSRNEFSVILSKRINKFSQSYQE